MKNKKSKNEIEVTESEAFNANEFDSESEVSSKKKIQKLPIVILIVAILASGVLIGSKSIKKDQDAKLPVTMKPGPVVQWDMDMNGSLFNITSRLSILGELSGEAKVAECKNLTKMLTTFSAAIPPAPDKDIQNGFSTWIQSVSNGVSSCANNEKSSDEELKIAADNFQTYINLLNEARVKNN